MISFSEKQVENITTLLFKGECEPVKLILNKHGWGCLHDFVLRIVTSMPLFIEGLGGAREHGAYAFFIKEVWDYSHLIKELKKRNFSTVFFRETVTDILSFNLKCQKCKKIYFPSDFSSELFFSIIQEKRPDIQVIIHP